MLIYFQLIRKPYVMKPIEQMKHFQIAEDVVNILNIKTGNDNKLFYRILLAHTFGVCASMMRTNIQTHDRGTIPINVYAISLATSGFSKGYSTNIIEDIVTNQFRQVFTHQTMPSVAEDNLIRIANRRSAVNSTDQEEELEGVKKEFKALGYIPFDFSEGTSPAVKQVRQTLLMANSGAINLTVDEIGSNLLGVSEVLNTFLELYDVGKVKQKLTKNTKDNPRNEDLVGRTPANMMLYGTPTKLLNGTKTEEDFTSFLETGYARRCIFGYATPNSSYLNMTAEEVYDKTVNSNGDGYLHTLSGRLGGLADEANFGKTLTMSKEVSIMLIEYKQRCELISASLPEHEEIRKAEISHRYFKALKIAGAYGFINQDIEITPDTLEAAIKLVEESGEAFNTILTRDKNYVKLAKYVASVGTECTHADLIEALPFFKGSGAHKSDLITMATSWGYKHHHILKKSYRDGIEFISGETLEETDLEKLIMAYSDDFTEGYESILAPFNQLENLTQEPNLHWVNHSLKDGYRDEEHVIAGFNTVVLDIDEGTSIETVKLLLRDYTYHLHTSKSHQKDKNGIVCDRFRVILPLSHKLKMTGGEFKQYMKNVYEWLPFGVDDKTGQRARKWATHKGTFHVNDGELLDATLFIPDTRKNEERVKSAVDLGNLDSLERWFCNNTGSGNRSNQLIKYAFMLADSGKDFADVRSAVIQLNEKLQDSIEESEIDSTIMVSVAKKIGEQDSDE